jgi:adenine-specific DNA-methyltransferase
VAIGGYIQQGMFQEKRAVVEGQFDPDADVVIARGDSLTFLKDCPDNVIDLVFTSPPYNQGKEYEKKKGLGEYMDGIKPILTELVRVLAPTGSLCWQVGNHVQDGEVFPLDFYYTPLLIEMGLRLRARMIWAFGHGLHCKNRLSGRHETVLWFTKTDRYTMNLNENNRSDFRYPEEDVPENLWRLLEEEWADGVWKITNVKSNHPEKTAHPCQFPIEMAERCVLPLTNRGDWVLDPFGGAGSTMLAAVKHGRKAILCEKEDKYIAIAKERLEMWRNGVLPYRPLGKPIIRPENGDKYGD